MYTPLHYCQQRSVLWGPEFVRPVRGREDVEPGERERERQRDVQALTRKIGRAPVRRLARRQGLGEVRRAQPAARHKTARLCHALTAAVPGSRTRVIGRAVDKPRQ